MIESRKRLHWLEHEHDGYHRRSKTKLDGLIAKAAQGELVVITTDDKPVAQLVPATPARPKPQAGRCRGMLFINAEDDEHLKDFAEYMP